MLVNITCTLNVFSFKMKMAVKMKTEYRPVLDMPVLKEGRDKGPLHASDPYGLPEYPLPGMSFFLAFYIVVLLLFFSD